MFVRRRRLSRMSLAWPRVVRRAFSDPRVPHESTGLKAGALKK